ncbi:MAG TPA: neuraminidase-like domain-containing protein [Solirubrobacterales bacterium]|jgi:hypothetical protein
MEIKPHLVMGASGEEVRRLHDALAVIGLQIDPEEREAEAFGASTVAAAIKLQALAGIEQSGAVDENTSAVIELALDRLGIRPGEGGFAAAEAPRAVLGTVSDEDGMPLAGALVVAFDRDLRDRVQIGEGRTDATGAYRIAYEAGKLIGERTSGDLEVEVRDEDDRVLATSPTAFNAPPTVTIDVPLGGPQRSRPPEVAALARTVQPLLGELAPLELREDEEHRDLSFLAGETGIAVPRLATWSVSERLEAETGLSSHLFYGLMRCGVPADAETRVLAESSAGVDFETNAGTVLEAILHTSAKTIASAIDHAIEVNVVPGSYAEKAPEELERLRALAGDAALRSPDGFGKTPLAEIFAATGVKKKIQKGYVDRYLANPGGPTRAFWQKLSEDEKFGPEAVADLRFALVVGRMTRGHLPLIEELSSRRQSRQVSHPADLARLTAAEWRRLLDRERPDGGRIGAPAFIDAETPAQANQIFAGMLERFFTRAYPTAAFSARVATGDGPFPAGAAVAELLDANPRIDLRRANLDHLTRDTEIEPEARESLLAAQRLVKLNPDYAVMSTLMGDEITSAQQVYALGRDNFLATYGSLPGHGPTAAARTWAMAEQTHAMAAATALKFSHVLDGDSPASIGKLLTDEVLAKTSDYPNLQTLFGSESACACEECESVLGAGAYLVDCLEFLGHRKTIAGNVRDALLARRPDIAQIQLSCENTNTELPFIDLVNELLEDAVAPGPMPAAKRQTTLTTPELNANPEYPNDPAYQRLAAASYPWTLPFDLPLAEARAYLAQIGLDRPGLTEAFRPLADPSADDLSRLAAERLGFSALEADVVTSEPAEALHEPWEYWGLEETVNTIVDPLDPTKTVSGDWLTVLAQARVLLNRSGLTYEQLSQLLNTIYVNGGGAVAIVASPPDSCDVAKMTLTGLDKGVLDRLHRFVRLMRRLEWDAYTLDDAIGVLKANVPAGQPRLDGLLLRQLAAVRDAAERFSLSVPRAVALLASAAGAASIETREIPTLPGEETRHSLYHDLFENRTVLNPPDPAFELNAARDEVATPGPLGDHAAGLVAALRVSETDLKTAIAGFTGGNLTLANLSALLRATQLAAGLELTVEQLGALLAIAEEPLRAAPGYARIAPFDGGRPESLRAFAEVAGQLAGTGLSIEQVDYIVRGSEHPGLAPDPLMVGTLLLTLWKGLDRIAGELAFAPDPLGTATRKALSGLLGGEQVDAVMAVLDDSSPDDDAGRSSVLDATLGAILDPGEALTHLVGTSALPPGEQRFEYVLEAVLAEQREVRANSLIVQTLGQSLGLSSATTALLLGNWFHSSSHPGLFMIADFRNLPAPSDATVRVPSDAVEFEPYFAAYAALAKVAALIRALRLGDADVEWWHDRGVALGWLDPTTLPAAQTPTAEGRFHQVMRLAAAAGVRDRIPAVNASFESLFGIAATAGKDEYFTTLVESTGWSADTLSQLCGDPDVAADTGSLGLAYPGDYLSETALARIVPCERTIARTGIPADVESWLATSVTAETAAAIKRSVKSGCSEQQWPEIAKRLSDGLRTRRRDALVSYLLAEPPAGVGRWLDANDVFAHFLIDVEMEPCMATSRIVQATAAVQLFVQRCFLSLEPGVEIDVGVDGDWLQWQWMSQYRVWEANRQVFLFPENWIDPTLRSNKSGFFAELEQDLKQSDVGDESAETALHVYLEKLERVARLDVVGTFQDLENGRSVLHVLARTQGSPPAYYRRHRLDAGNWDAWEEVKLDISGDHAIPLTWNGRHYLFWAIVTQKPDLNNQPAPAPQTSSSPPPKARTHLEIQLAWSQYKEGKWQAKQVAPQTLVRSIPVTDPQWDATHVMLRSSTNADQLEIDLFIGDPRIVADYQWRNVGRWVLGGAGSGVAAFGLYPEDIANAGGAAVAAVTPGLVNPKPSLPWPTATRVDGNWLAPGATKQASSYRPAIAPAYFSYLSLSMMPSELVLETADDYRLVIPHQTLFLDSTLPFFYRDKARQYYVVPTRYYKSGSSFVTAPTYTYQPVDHAAYTFFPFYHPFAGLLAARLNFGGLDALYERRLQLEPEAVQGTAKFSFSNYYQPTGMVKGPYPKEGIDFEPETGYALYNWETFFHAPFLIAKQLATNLRFEDAKRWFERIFNPTSPTKDPVPQRYWITKPFYLAAPFPQIEMLLKEINEHNIGLERQVAAWRADPFDPDMIAQLRPVAYQRAIVMAYIDNLIGWGDQLFRQNTRESINRATQLYVLAEELLGQRPERISPRVEPKPKTYEDLEGKLDVFSEAMVAAENTIPPVTMTVPTPPGSPPLPTVNTLYFRVPPNSRLRGYWDTVADRLFKIRHCMNIEGVAQQLSLFAPPIDPGALVAAAAAGIDLSSVLSDSEASLPPYRFRVLIAHAIELCGQVQQLGSSLLAALEKSDAEELARIRAGGERQLQAAIDLVRSQQIEEIEKEFVVLAESRRSAVDRQQWYSGRDFMNTWEEVSLLMQGGAALSQGLAAVLDGTAGVAHIVPTFEFGAAGFGGTPSVNAKIGGKEVGHAADSAAWVARMIAAALQTGSEMTATVGRYHQRQDEWDLQATLAADDIARIDAEAAVNQAKLQIAVSEKAAQDVAVKEAGDIEAFLQEKFTSKELYDWMVGQTATTYFQAYQLAYAIAKQAERCYRRELAVESSDFIQFGYWDSLRKGLTAGDKLSYDLRRLQSAYLTGDDRELEIVKHVSLLQIDPLALVALRETGSCIVSIPEILFDLDNPGHYLRRLKSVAVSVPCVVGPYTSVSMTVALLRNQVRTRAARSDDALLTDETTSEIVTSSGQDDNGLFELRLQDDRYLPFEGSGAISTWRLTLNDVRAQFDYETISDVVLHLRFTARDGGEGYAETVGEATEKELNSIALDNNRKGLYRMLSARHDFAAEWTRFLNPPPGEDQVMMLATPPERFPFFTAGLEIGVGAVDAIVRGADGAAYELVLTPPGGAAKTVTVSPDPLLDGTAHLPIALSPAAALGSAPSPAGEEPPAWTLKLRKSGAGDFRSLTADDVEDLILVLSYQVKQ